MPQRQRHVEGCPCCTATKRVNRAWFEGQDVEAPAVKALLPAFARYVRVLRKPIDEAIEDLKLNPTLDIIARMDQLPWFAADQELVAAWETVAARAYQRSGNNVVRKASPEEIRQLAIVFGNLHALELAEIMTLGSREGGKQALLDALRDNVAPRELARRVREVVGLTQRQALTLDGMRQRLLGQGLSNTRVNRDVGRRANKMRKRRAETIARTEVNRARNRGTRDAWRAQQLDGEIPEEAMMIWIANPGCRICTTIAAQGPVPLTGAWIHPVTGAAIDAPPAHPNCRCSPALVFP